MLWILMGLYLCFCEKSHCIIGVILIIKGLP